MRYYYYIDFGSGAQLITSYNNQTKLGWERGIINPLIARRKLTGQFTLLDSDASTAYTYFITNANFYANITMYEHGISGTGTLVYTGKAAISGSYNISENTITLANFEVLDEYTPLIEIIKNEHSGETLTIGSALDQFTIQGVNANADNLKALTWSSPDFSQTGNDYAIAITGRPCACSISSDFVIYDDHTRSLRRFSFDGTDFSPAANGTELVIPETANYGQAALTAYDADEVVLAISGLDVIRKYQAVSTTWTKTLDVDLHETRYPSITLIDTGVLAIVDDKTKTLRSLNSSFAPVGLVADLGEVSKPKICGIATNIIALIDDNIRELQAWTYSSGVWGKTGQPLSLPQMVDPSICWIAANTIAIHDAYLGKIYYYSFSGGTTWSLTGSGTALTGGYSSAIAHGSTYTYIVISDSVCLSSRLSPSIPTVINSVLFLEGIDSDYAIDGSTCDATFDIEELFFGSLETLEDIGDPTGITPSNNYMYSISQMLKFAEEIFQNYWYLEESGGVYYFKFAVPADFSSFGSDIDSSEWSTLLNSRLYNEEIFIRREKLVFNNQVTGSFIGDWIEYDKNTDIELITDIPITTDFQNIINYMTKRNYIGYGKSGLFMVYIEGDSYNRAYAPAGTSPLGATNVKNEACCTSRIYEDYMKDYRYANAGSFTLNGNVVAVQDTARDVMRFLSVNLKLTNFPTSIANLDWGTYSSFINNLEVDCVTYIFTVDSIQLDL